MHPASGPGGDRNRKDSATEAVELVFLGGLAEVGKNMLLLEYGEDCIVVDCGLAFPEEEQLGIDLVLPDISYLRGRSHQIRGIFISHGHEDHIGALPYLLPDLRYPADAWLDRGQAGGG